MKEDKGLPESVEQDLDDDEFFDAIEDGNIESDAKESKVVEELDLDEEFFDAISPEGIDAKVEVEVDKEAGTSYYKYIVAGVCVAGVVGLGVYTGTIDMSSLYLLQSAASNALGYGASAVSATASAGASAVSATASVADTVAAAALSTPGAAAHVAVQAAVTKYRGGKVHPVQTTMLAAHGTAMATLSPSPVARVVGTTMAATTGTAQAVATVTASYTGQSTEAVLTGMASQLRKPTVFALTVVGVICLGVLAHYMLIPTLIAVSLPVHMIGHGLIFKSNSTFPKTQLTLIALHTALVFSVLPLQVAYVTMSAGSAIAIAGLGYCKYKGITFETALKATYGLIGKATSMVLPTQAETGYMAQLFPDTMMSVAKYKSSLSNALFGNKDSAKSESIEHGDDKVEEFFDANEGPKVEVTNKHEGPSGPSLGG